MHVVPGSHRDPRFSPEAKKEEEEGLAQDPALKTERAKIEERILPVSECLWNFQPVNVCSTTV